MSFAALPSSLLGDAMLAITYLGWGPVLVVLVILYSWWIDPRAGRRLAVAFGLSLAVNGALKELLRLPRPFQVAGGPEVSEAARATAGGFGFPSGHTQGTATVWTFLAWWHRRRWLTVLALVLIPLVAFSRLFLGVHFLSDVLGGLVLGLAFAAAGRRVPDPLPVAWCGVVGAAGLVAAVIGGPSVARPLGLAVGALAARPGLALSGPWWWRLLLAVGGLVSLGLLGALVTSLVPGLLGVAWSAYLVACGLGFFALDLWPRVVLRAS